MEARTLLLSDDLVKSIDWAGSVQSYYDETLSGMPRQYEGNSTEWGADEDRLREIAYLTLKWFMPTLTDRMDRMGAYTGVAARLPFTDTRLMAYVWSIPWALKRKDGVVKHVLREAARGLVPDEVLFRKKSPFPKTYDPLFTKRVGDRLLDVLANPNAPVAALVNPEKVKSFIEAPSNVSRPWFGQLMAGPQMLAFLLQINYWLEKYHVSLMLS